MNLKRKSFIIINMTLLISLFLFFILTEKFGKRYYFYQKNIELNNIESTIQNNIINPSSDVLIGKIPVLQNNFEFNNALKISLFQKNNWKYDFWFGDEALKRLNKTGSITRNFQQKNLNSSFLIRVFKKENNYIIICLSLPSIEENIKLMRTFFLYIFLFISLFIWCIYTYYLRKITYSISSIEFSLDKISKKDFSKVSLIKSGDEFESISKKISEISLELNEYFEFLNKRYESQKHFYNSLAHELKTPITIINGYAYYIKDILKEEDKVYCDFIINECIGISQMAKKFQLLAENSKSLEFSRFHLNTLIENILEKFYLDFSEKNIDVSFISNSVEVYADYNLIKVAITNLISNSLKFTKNNIIIKINSDSNHIIFSIYNNGHNIPKDKILKIWEPFFFMEKHSKIDNWGFGLAIVADIINKHNGNYAVENTIDGVIFKIILPNI
ncbi:HAMP domain-containing sensor histidine kinase [Candidatus Cetobacterium colombiensis]|uniref:histidine kinase n=1 Tax=Candidatus Cetobacterium colombiensis TaxID=3073100 RepID=A0ABU4WAQ6_9FUSO|nr:HAMP domain-containing sensor histidine kinase [Candidatus Cetobacterium colombiensis]MDX8335661.1 HAMP domain-containing sensor histidine kinase [Candidatus Cetobacterium colombiensis]